MEALQTILARYMDRAEFESEIARASCWSFRPALEDMYVARCGPSMARHMARAATVNAVLTLAAIGFDRSNSLEVFAAAWPWRCLAAMLCAGVAMFGFRSRDGGRTGLAYGIAVLAIMASIEFAGVAAPPATQENYMLAAIILFAVCLAAVPIPFVAGLMTCLIGAILHPLLPVLYGAGTSHLFSDSIIGSAASLTILLVIRKNEIGRRRRFLETLRYELAATELSLMNRELLRLSNTDALTGLPNRRFFEAEAARLCAERGNRSIGAILMDVDHFKKYNDAAGHIAGDVCLRTVAQALAGKAREDGVSIVRYGGEEFAAMIPANTPSELETLCEGLKNAVANIKLSHPGLPGQNVSISIGLAWRDELADEPQSLLEEADRALYDAKAAGRNCISWPRAATPSPSIIPVQGVSGVTPNVHS
ncbi:GGDEF domain-containing protein [Bradyrhizobium manausense]|uniref:GGDEF domain-containing protein n=1 Tax=Bradyrhizobium manausense TaxID=989370 RepID=UPI001BA73390|nr:GGDEF domain-containing protein [Bradyrhizobium manausense]MBR0832944.1 GGDEF domain-containing protein [Bradyrhizobium manausense]